MLLLGVLFVFGTCLFFSRYAPEDAYTTAKTGIYTETAAVTGLFLYEETVVSAAESGTFYPGLFTGDAVSAGEVCGELHRLNDLFTDPVMVMTSPCSGIYSEVTDGWEDILTAEALSSLDLPAVFRNYEVTERISAFRRGGDACFKVMDNKKDLCLLLSLGELRPEGERTELLLGGERFFCEILSRRYFGNDLYALVKVAPRDICYASREVEVDVVLRESEGLLVDTAALFHRFGEVGVYRADGDSLAFCPVEVLCGDDAVSLITGVDEGIPLLLGKS